VSLQETQRPQRPRKARKPRKSLVPRTPMPAFVNDAQIMTINEWCALNSIGHRTGRRILALGEGPVITELSEKRIGISVRANREWQASRERAA
jgi:hypothetical protein